MNSICQTPVDFLDKWDALKIVGSGSTCDVILVKKKTKKTKKVMKLYKPKVDIRITEAEARLLLSLDHPRVLSASGYYTQLLIPQADEGSSVNNKSETIPALVTEYVPNGDLLALVQKFNRLPEIIARSYFLQLLDALEYIHGQEICHLDIKPDNILIDENYCLKLADFGAALKISKDSMVKGTAGTTTYHAPEIHANKSYSTYQADLFALGITLFTMVSGSMPFVAAKESDPVYSLIAEEKYDEFWDLHEEISGHSIKFSKSFRDLIEAMFALDVTKRLSLERIKKHPWARGIVPSDDKLSCFIKDIMIKSKCAEEAIPTKVTHQVTGVVAA
eukprot:CAMPEP_0176446174 /NCGR_PEP_ID=MMETSP0127-20121128/24160_1 /TAXON_ID=938130 /ORGANISM="Platyophrya macrostoma, Strain WH" /LENGTH=332 /DNA_ID=CAMNT_0017832141 /DNA_START=45 /DNA_END=1044 /DNA_ORIENTATION=+